MSIVVPRDRVSELDLNRLKDANDSYEEILVDPEREIIYKDGEYVLGKP